MNTTLTYPLTKKALKIFFQDLDPEDITVDKSTKGWHEGQVDGSWKQRKITTLLAEAGFTPVKGSDRTSWVNKDETVGVVLMGTKIHPTKNRFTEFNLEVQARKTSRTPAPMSFTRFAECMA